MRVYVDISLKEDRVLTIDYFTNSEMQPVLVIYTERAIGGPTKHCELCLEGSEIENLKAILAKGPEA